MDESWNFRAFSEAEHRSRLDAARRVMDGAGLDACVCTSPELLYYFTGYEAHTHHAIGSQALVFTADGADPILILRDGDVPQANETVVVGDIRPFRLGASELGALIADALSARGVSPTRIGLDLSGPTMNGALSGSIRSALQSEEVQDCWRLLGRLRTVLSEAEISYLKEATRFADIGIDAFYDKARAGISEIELAAEIEYAMRSAGSDYAAVPTWMASGERAYCQHAMASPRKLRSGDLVHAEFAGVARRYQSVTMGSLVLGEPSARMREMAEGGKSAFDAGLRAARVGGRIGDMEAAYRDTLAALGLGDCCPMRFGTGLSAAYPPVWENQITIQFECDDRFEAGMAFYIHASMQSMEDRTGMLLGGSFLMTPAGPERLDKAPIELIVIDG
jgi:Xaa-Pro aminopeptidase